jgi:hypothetical protein
VSAAKQSEASITKQIMGWLKAQPWTYASKIHGGSFGRGGRPDVQGNVGPIVFYMEIKTEIGKLAPRQMVEIEKIRKSGAIVAVVRSLAEAQAVHRGARALAGAIMKNLA